MSISEERAKHAEDRAVQLQKMVVQAKEMKDKGYSNAFIAVRMGISESYVRNLVRPNIDGPYSFKDVDGLKTPIYIFEPGGKRKDIGEVTVKVENGMIFSVELDEEYKDIESAFFDVPMRYVYTNRK